MFPDFPSPKNQLSRLLVRWLSAQSGNLSPLLRDLRSYRQHEGKAGKLERIDGTTGEIEFQEISGAFSLDRNDMKSFDLESLKAKLMQAAQEIAGAQERIMLQRISAAAASVGNTVSLGGRELQPEDILNSLRKIRLDFDPLTGEPKLPTMVVHPSQVEKLREKAAEWSADPALEKEREQIIADKREEWNARENLRKLVD